HADDVIRRTIGRAGVHVTSLASVWRVAEKQKETHATRRIEGSEGTTEPSDVRERVLGGERESRMWKFYTKRTINGCDLKTLHKSNF
ncbi:hypothetical protein ALC62_08722, partial [Cyphomyrmex costatus]